MNWFYIKPDHRKKIQVKTIRKAVTQNNKLVSSDFITQAEFQPFSITETFPTIQFRDDEDEKKKDLLQEKEQKNQKLRHKIKPATSQQKLKTLFSTTNQFANFTQTQNLQQKLLEVKRDQKSLINIDEIKHKQFLEQNYTFTSNFYKKGNQGNQNAITILKQYVQNPVIQKKVGKRSHSNDVNEHQPQDYAKEHDEFKKYLKTLVYSQNNEVTAIEQKLNGNGHKEDPYQKQNDFEMKQRPSEKTIGDMASSPKRVQQKQEITQEKIKYFFSYSHKKKSKQLMDINVIQLDRKGVKQLRKQKYQQRILTMSANLKRTARVIKGITGYNNIFGQIILKGKHLDEYYEEFNQNYFTLEFFNFLVQSSNTHEDDLFQYCINSTGQSIFSKLNYYHKNLFNYIESKTKAQLCIKFHITILVYQNYNQKLYQMKSNMFELNLQVLPNLKNISERNIFYKIYKIISSTSQQFNQNYVIYQNRQNFMKQENLIENFEKMEANLGQFKQIGNYDRLMSKNIDLVQESIRNEEILQYND